MPHETGFCFFHRWYKISSNPAHKACGVNQVIGSLVRDGYLKREIFKMYYNSLEFLFDHDRSSNIYLHYSEKRSKYLWNWRLQRFSCTCDVNFRWTDIERQDWVVVGVCMAELLPKRSEFTLHLKPRLIFWSSVVFSPNKTKHHCCARYKPFVQSRQHDEM